MAKKRKAKAKISRSKSKSIKAITMKKPMKAMPVRRGKRRSKAAYVISIIAIVLLVINGIVSLAAHKQIVRGLIDIGMDSSASLIVTYGIVWLILALLIWVTIYEIEKKGSTASKWFLLVLGIITLFSGRAIEAILIIVASVIYIKRR